MAHYPNNGSGKSSTGGGLFGSATPNTVFGFGGFSTPQPGAKRARELFDTADDDRMIPEAKKPKSAFVNADSPKRLTVADYISTVCDSVQAAIETQIASGKPCYSDLLRILENQKHVSCRILRYLDVSVAIPSKDDRHSIETVLKPEHHIDPQAQPYSYYPSFSSGIISAAQKKATQTLLSWRSQTALRVAIEVTKPASEKENEIFKLDTEICMEKVESRFAAELKGSDEEYKKLLQEVHQFFDEFEKEKNKIA
ncbi:hypothetical protein BJ508DRAFT_309273 [Ascobolus immersus RN42]|uniref:Uncharacterized protein n=1 Tax=Ascobolus immersus RN42 TaxID=1160509 RepID=A0A3N4HXA8_ASCIM|nr:hypothetical protein BJ508DRAFT_309273 [Ascobolus immersus RN42]